MRDGALSNKDHKGGAEISQAEPFSAWPWIAAFFLIITTLLAYFPVIRDGGFIWDDDLYVTANRHLLSAQGLLDIWTKPGPMRGGTPQYYPLTFSSLWLDYRFWKLQPLGYHLVNVLLHAFNAVLVWRVLRRLCVPGALLAAAVFAFHPVNVESVAWIAERKNVLSGFFYLLSLLFYLRFMDIQKAGPQPSEDKSRLRFYFLAMILFICALASKTVTASLPAAILLILWWKNGSIRWKDLLLTAPMFLLGAGSGLFTAYVEKYQAGASGAEWLLTPVEHCLLAGRSLWFYLGKLAWPQELMFSYPRWEIDQGVWSQYLFPLAAAAVTAGLWFFRRRIGKGPLAAALFFAGTLAPVLGFLNVYPLRFSYVADHFLYLASLGPIALGSAGLALGWSRLEPRAAGIWKKAAIASAGILLLTLGLLTWRQGGIYKNSDLLWRDTIRKNPASWMAHNNLGCSLQEQGRTEEAISHFREALRAKPDFAYAQNNLGVALQRQGQTEEAIAHFREALRIIPDFENAHLNLGTALGEQGKTEEALSHIKEAFRLKNIVPATTLRK